MAQFYGWTDLEIRKLDYDTALEYYECVTILDARNRLVDLNVSGFTSMKKEDRNKLHRQLSKLANPQHLRKEMDFEEFFKKVKGQ